MKRRYDVKKIYLKLLSLSEEGISQLKSKKYEKFDDDAQKILSIMEIYHSIEKKSYSLPESIRKDVSEILGEDVEDLFEVLWDEDTGINTRLIWEMTKNRLPKLTSYLQNKINEQDQSS